MKYAYLSRGLVLSLLVALTVACGPVKYTIVLPEADAEFINVLPNQFLIEFTEELSKISLNGIDVTHHFEFSDVDATASGEDLAAYLKQGDNVLAVQDLFGPRRSFFYDSEGPSVALTAVQHEGGSVAISGTLVDPSDELMSLTVNGAFTNVDADGHFSLSIDTDSYYRFVADDALGHQSTTIYSQRGNIVEDMTRLKISESAVRDILPLVQEIIEEQDLGELLVDAGANALFRENVGVSFPEVEVVPAVCVFGVCTPKVALGPYQINILSVEAKLNKLTFDEIELQDFDLMSGQDPLQGAWEGVNVDARIDGTDFDVSVNLSVLGFDDAIRNFLNLLGVYDKLSFLAGDFNIAMKLPQIRFDSKLGLSATDGEVDVKVIDVNAIGLAGVNSDFDIRFPDKIKDFGFGLSGAILGVVERGIEGARDVMVEIFLGKLVPVVASKVLDPLIDELQLNLAATINNGALFSAFLAIDDIHIVNDDTMYVALNGRIGTEKSDEAVGDINLGIGLGTPKVTYISDHFLPDVPGIPDSLGDAPGLAPEPLGFRFIETAVPTPVGTDDMTVNINANMLNQALLGIYEAGLLSLTVPVLVENNSFLIADAEQANAFIHFQPTSSPEMTFKGGAISLAYLTLNNYSISVELKKADGSWENIAGAAINTQAPVQFGAEDEIGLNIALLAPDLSFDLQFNSGQDSIVGLVLGSIVSTIIVEQINVGLALIQLPENLELNMRDERIDIRPGAISLVGEPKTHFSFGASFEAR